MFYQHSDSFRDTQRIEDGSGSKVANFIKEFTTLVSGLVIAFILNWRITLVVFGFIPLLVLGIIFLGKVSTTYY